MNRLEAHKLIIDRYNVDPRSLRAHLPESLELRRTYGCDPTCGVLTAFAVFGFGVDDCQTLEELLESVDHGVSCFSAGLFDYSELIEETTATIAELLRWIASQPVTEAEWREWCNG